MKLFTYCEKEKKRTIDWRHGEENNVDKGGKDKERERVGKKNGLLDRIQRKVHLHEENLFIKELWREIKRWNREMKEENVDEEGGERGGRMKKEGVEKKKKTKK